MIPITSTVNHFSPSVVPNIFTFDSSACASQQKKKAADRDLPPLSLSLFFIYLFLSFFLSSIFFYRFIPSSFFLCIYFFFVVVLLRVCVVGYINIPASASSASSSEAIGPIRCPGCPLDYGHSLKPPPTPSTHADVGGPPFRTAPLSRRRRRRYFTTHANQVDRDEKTIAHVTVR